MLNLLYLIAEYTIVSWSFKILRLDAQGNLVRIIMYVLIYDWYWYDIWAVNIYWKVKSSKNRRMYMALGISTFYYVSSASLIDNECSMYIHMLNFKSVFLKRTYFPSLKICISPNKFLDASMLPNFSLRLSLPSVNLRKWKNTYSGFSEPLSQLREWSEPSRLNLFRYLVYSLTIIKLYLKINFLFNSMLNSM